jgi:hypothetical protein
MSFIPLGILAAAGGAGGGGAAFESIATVNPVGGASSISFTGIPSTYKHLQIRGIMHDDFGTDKAPNTGFDMGVQFNSDSTGANYARHHLYGNGSSAVAAGSADSLITLPGTNQISTANYMSVMIIDIQDYASTTKNKTLRAFNGADANGTGTTNRVVALNSGLWKNTAAINEIKLVAYGTGFVAPTQFSLYGIKGD